MDVQTAKFALRVLWGRVTGKGYPFLVQLNVTNRCNYRCSYCYAAYYKRSSDELNLNQVKSVIDELYKAGLFRLNFVGGEPLLRKDIGEIITYARNKKIQCAMTTNGSLVPKRINELKGLNTVCFSVDGRPENNDFNRGRGTYEKALAGLLACQKAGIPVQLSAVITKQTFNDIDYMAALAEKRRCRVSFSVLISQCPDSGTPEHDLSPSDEHVQAALRRILELKKQGKPVLFSVESYRYAMTWPDYSRDFIMGKAPVGFSPISCYAGMFFCLVDYNGDVYPCPQLIGVFKPGNILRDSFAAAFRKASEHGCKACSIPCSTDFNMFFGLKPRVLADHFLNYGRRRN